MLFIPDRKISMGVATSTTKTICVKPRRPKLLHNLFRSRVPAILLFVISVAATAATESDLFDVPLEQLGQIEITTAAKVSEPLTKTAATVSVITAKDLRRMGARSIYDALARLPGIQVGRSEFGDHFIAIRGIRTTWSEKVLLLLDGHLLNDARSGSGTYQFLDSLPVDNIARIEVVIGPGSALYGANAFLGVINIITKRPDEIGGVELAGSDELESAGTVARRYNLLAGGNLSDNWQGGVNLNVLDAPGPELDVTPDAFGRSGMADSHVDRLDVQGNISNGPFTLRSRYLRRKAGDEFGALYVLDSASTQKVENMFLDAEYSAHPLYNSALTLRAYVDRQDTNNYYVALPAGTIPATSVYSPWNSTGLIGDTLAKESTGGVEAQFDSYAIAFHTLTSGLAWRREKLHDVHFLANFDPNPLPRVTDVSDHYNWIDPASRNIASLYVQDLWDIQSKLRATLGARYDHFSDSGSTFNPRVGLTWQLETNIRARLTYGTAFRAPSFVEQYFKNNPAQLGNPDLTAEKVKTWEAGVNWQGRQLRTGLTLSHSDMRNLIDIPSGTIQYQNLGKAEVNGVELDAGYHFQSGPDITANYSFANPNYTNLQPAILTPRQYINLVADVPLPAGIAWNIHGGWQSHTPRAGGDTRPALDSVWLMNTALTMKRGRWDFSAAVYNITDQHYAVSAPAGTLPGDFTAPGRSFLVGARYGF